MKLIPKTKLNLIDGYLVDDTGELVAMNALAKEANELLEISELMDFLKANKTDILASSKPVVFKPTSQVVEAPRFKTDKTVETPLLDEEVARKEALAEEFLDMQSIKDIDQHLIRYHELARWFANEYIIVSGDVQVVPVKFVGNILALTKDEVIAIVEDMHDADLSKLRDMVTIDFS